MSKKYKYKPLSADEIEDLIQPCPEGSDDMFWRQDEIVRIEREHYQKFLNKTQLLNKLQTPQHLVNIVDLKNK